MQRVIFIVLPRVELLDLAGPLQAFFEAGPHGGAYEAVLCGPVADVASNQGVHLARLAALPDPDPNDLVLVPGIDLAHQGEIPSSVYHWLHRAHEAGAHLASVCTGAFILAEAGLLSGRRCTTHWARVDDLQRRYPRALVLRDRLFVQDGAVTTSAGIASGLDMALWFIEQQHGPLVAARTARELVVYLRRDGAQQQHSVYLDYRAHLHTGIHRVQDWLIAHPEARPTLDELAGVAAMSPRHLTRVFREATGITIHAYTTALRLERAARLLADPDRTLDAVAAACGFGSTRHFRRAWKARYGTPPSAARTTTPARASP